MIVIDRLAHVTFSGGSDGGGRSLWLRLRYGLGHSLSLLKLQSFFDLLEVLLKLALSLSLDIQALEQMIELVVTLVVEPAVLSVCGHYRLILLLKQLLSYHLV